jgi:hypothetical protein
MFVTPERRFSTRVGHADQSLDESEETVARGANRRARRAGQDEQAIADYDKAIQLGA